MKLNKTIIPVALSLLFLVGCTSSEPDLKPGSINSESTSQPTSTPTSEPTSVPTSEPTSEPTSLDPFRLDGTDHEVRYEAEDAIHTVGTFSQTKVSECPNASGGKIVADIDNCGLGLEFYHFAPVAGEHTLTIAYWTGAAGSKDAVFLNETFVGEAVFSENTGWANGSNAPGTVTLTLNLVKGWNSISLCKHGFGNDNPAWGGWAQLDYFQIEETEATYDPTTIDKSLESFTLECEYGSFHTGGNPFKVDNTLNVLSCYYAVGEINAAGNGVDLSLVAPVSGTYKLNLRYSQGGSNNNVNVQVGEAEAVTVPLAAYNGQAWNVTGTMDLGVNVDLVEGEETIVKLSRAETSDWFILDALNFIKVVE